MSLTEAQLSNRVNAIGYRLDDTKGAIVSLQVTYSQLGAMWEAVRDRIITNINGWDNEPNVALKNRLMRLYLNFRRAAAIIKWTNQANQDVDAAIGNVNTLVDFNTAMSTNAPAQSWPDEAIYTVHIYPLYGELVFPSSYSTENHDY